LVVGLETVSGKSSDPVHVGKVLLAGGAGSGLVEGDHVTGTGGTEGNPDCVGPLCIWFVEPQPLAFPTTAANIITSRK
jgi:hypothetical protein